MAKKHNIYTFYAELNDYEPKIWRRFEVNSEKTVAELSYALMIMFEMQGSHLFQLREYTRDAWKKYIFEENGVESEEVRRALLEDLKDNCYEFLYDDIFEEEFDVIPPNEVRLSSMWFVGMKFLLKYDYGDGWEVSLVLEDIREENISLRLLPRVLEGEGYGIVEDVGGVIGLTHLAELLRIGSGEEFDYFTTWLDSTTLDLESFDKDDINFRLKKLIRVYRDMYEYEWPPSKASIKIMMRDYLGKGSRGY